MKKNFLIFLGIFILIFLPKNVFALSYSRCNDTILVNEDTLIYYLYDNYTTNFNNYNYFLLYKRSNGTNYYDILFFNNTTDIYFTNNHLYLNNGLQLSFYSDFSLRGSWSITSSTHWDSFSTSYYYNNAVIPGSVYTDPSLDITITKDNLRNYFLNCSPNTYTITYYLNNQIYQVINDVEEGSSHTLLYYEPSSEYNFSGWSYDNNIDLTNITSNVDIFGTTTLKPYYTITYYLDNRVHDTISVIEGTNYNLANYIPPRNYIFSGWSYDNNIDLTNITSNVDIFGTTTYVRPSMNYSEESNSIIHNISYEILGNSIPVEFDFLYTIMDFIILLIIVLCVLSPFVILYKLLGGVF